MASKCKMCGFPTSYPPGCDPGRAAVRMCEGCFSIHEQTQRGEAQREWAKGSDDFQHMNVEDYEVLERGFCRNCGYDTTWQEESERIKQRLCLRCWGWWEENPSDDELKVRMMRGY